MTDEEKIDAVTAKLAGQFHVGQRVRVCNSNLVDYDRLGIVKDLDPPAVVGVQLALDVEDNLRYYYVTSLELAP